MALDSQYDPTMMVNLPAAIRQAIKDFGIALQICIPVIVTNEYDPKTDLVRVKPIPDKVGSSDGEESVEEWDEFPVHPYRLGFGKFHLVGNIEVGSTGWVFSSDRDTKQARTDNSKVDISSNVGHGKPVSTDMGQYTQGFFLPDRWGPSDKDGGDKFHLGWKEYASQFGLRIGDKKIGIFVDEDGVVTIVNNGDEGEKKVVIDFSKMEQPGTMSIAKKWVIDDVGGESMTLSQVYMVCSEEPLDSKTAKMQDATAGGASVEPGKTITIE